MLFFELIFSFLMCTLFPALIFYMLFLLYEMFQIMEDVKYLKKLRKIQKYFKYVLYCKPEIISFITDYDIMNETGNFYKNSPESLKKLYKILDNYNF